MSEQKRKPLSSSEEEISLLKRAFSENEILLKAVRCLFLGFKISKTEMDLIRSNFKDINLVKALKKKMYPEIDPTSNIGELSDFWLGTETEIIGKDPETINQIVASKQMTLELLESAFNLLKEPTNNSIDLSFDYTGRTDKFQIKLLARNKYIKSVETGLTILKVIAGQKEETIAQAKERLQKESSK